MVVGVVGESVGVVAGGCLGELSAGVFVEGDHAVGTGGGGVHPVPGRDDEDAVDLVDAADDPDGVVGVDVDFDDLAGAEVRDEQQSAIGVEAGVVEAGAVPGQGEFADLVQWQGHGRWRSVAYQQDYREDGDDHEGRCHHDGGDHPWSAAAPRMRGGCGGVWCHMVSNLAVRNGVCEGQGAGLPGRRRPVRVTVTRRSTAAWDGRLLAALSACRQ